MSNLRLVYPAIVERVPGKWSLHDSRSWNLQCSRVDQLILYLFCRAGGILVEACPFDVQYLFHLVDLRCSDWIYFTALASRVRVQPRSPPWGPHSMYLLCATLLTLSRMLPSFLSVFADRCLQLKFLSFVIVRSLSFPNAQIHTVSWLFVFESKKPHFFPNQEESSAQGQQSSVSESDKFHKACTNPFSIFICKKMMQVDPFENPMQPACTLWHSPSCEKYSQDPVQSANATS